jgi:hypothetical protein
MTECRNILTVNKNGPTLFIPRANNLPFDPRAKIFLPVLFWKIIVNCRYLQQRLFRNDKIIILGYTVRSHINVIEMCTHYYRVIVFRVNGVRLSLKCGHQRAYCSSFRRCIPEHRDTVEWYWQGKTEKLGEKTLPVPVRPPEIPYWLSRVQSPTYAIRHLSHGSLTIDIHIISNFLLQQLVSDTIFTVRFNNQQRVWYLYVKQQKR